MDKDVKKDEEFEAKIEDWKTYLERINKRRDEINAQDENSAVNNKEGFICLENRTNVDIKDLQNSIGNNTVILETTTGDSIKDYMFDAPVIGDSSSSSQLRDSDKKEDSSNSQNSPKTPKNKSRFIEIDFPIISATNQVNNISLHTGFTSPMEYKFRGVSGDTQDSIGSCHKQRFDYSNQPISKNFPKAVVTNEDPVKVCNSDHEKTFTEGSLIAKNTTACYMNGTIPSDMSQEMLDYMETKIKLQNAQIEAYKENIQRQNEMIVALKQEIRLLRAKAQHSDSTILKQLADRGFELIREMRNMPGSADLTEDLTRERLTVESLKNVIQELSCRIKNNNGE
ncbi:hypothetical protein PAEPH01_0418 [Pancytospora epiphaga]|nr:hypothetical protein PAEPH01_0418 [Pancytospora epiphaga]